MMALRLLLACALVASEEAHHAQFAYSFFEQARRISSCHAAFTPENCHYSPKVLLGPSVLQGAPCVPLAVSGFACSTCAHLLQAFELYEEVIPDSKDQLVALYAIMGTLHRCLVFEAEEREILGAKAMAYSAKLLKKSDQCRAVCACSHLYWQETQVCMFFKTVSV
jgi:hypothetical protein